MTMQGRPDSGGDSRDQSGSRHAASLNGTGKTPPASQRSAIPRAGQSSAKPRVSSQLETPRVAHTRRKVAVCVFRLSCGFLRPVHPLWDNRLH